MAELRRELTIFSCTLLVAGNMIGIGIFVTASRIYTLLPNPTYILLAWIVGGLLSLAGALAYAELASRFPRAGGGYVFSREAFGPMFGFLAGFSASLVTLPGTAAFLAMGFTRYAGISDPLTAKIIGIGLILSISYINYRGVTRGAILQDGFMVLKLALIFILIVAGFASMNGSLSHFLTALPSASPLLALVPIMFTYSGWDASVYVAGEIKNPQKTLPFSMFFGTLLVMVVYITLAMLYLYAIPVDSPISKTAIVTSVSNVFFGSTVAKYVGGLVAISVLGCLSATILTGPRVIYAMAKDRLLPGFLGSVNSTFHTPAKAIWFHGIWACVLLISGTFDQLLDYVTVPAVFFAAINVAGLFILRKKNRADTGAAPYLTLGYPVIPALFVIGMLGIVINTAINDPLNSLWGLGMVVLGVPIYFIWTRLLK